MRKRRAGKQEGRRERNPALSVNTGVSLSGAQGPEASARVIDEELAADPGACATLISRGLDGGRYYVFTTALWRLSEARCPAQTAAVLVATTLLPALSRTMAVH